MQLSVDMKSSSYIGMFVILTVVMTAISCSLTLINYGVNKTEFEKVLAANLPAGTPKAQVDSFIEKYSREHFKQVEIHKDLYAFDNESMGLNDERIKDNRQRIKSISSVNIPETRSVGIDALYLHITFYYDENNNLLQYVLTESVHK
jgi:hypothetical protein